MKYIKSFDTTAELNEYLQTTENNYYVLEDKEADSLTYLKPVIEWTGLKFTANEDNCYVGIAQRGDITTKQMQYSLDGGADIPVAANGAPEGWDYKGTNPTSITDFNSLEFQVGDEVFLSQIINYSPVVSDTSAISFNITDTSVADIEGSKLVIKSSGSTSITATLGDTTINSTIEAYTTFKYVKTDFSDLVAGDNIIISQYFGRLSKYGAMKLNNSGTSSYATMRCNDPGTIGDEIAAFNTNAFSKFIVYSTDTGLSIRDTEYNYSPYSNAAGSLVYFSDGTYSSYTALNDISVDTNTESAGYGYMLRSVGNSYFCAIVSTTTSLPTTFTWTQASILGNFVDQHVQFYKLVKEL